MNKKYKLLKSNKKTWDGKPLFQFAVYGSPDKQSKIGDFTC